MRPALSLAVLFVAAPLVAAPDEGPSAGSTSAGSTSAGSTSAGSTSSPSGDAPSTTDDRSDHDDNASGNAAGAASGPRKRRKKSTMTTTTGAKKKKKKASADPTSPATASSTRPSKKATSTQAGHEDDLQFALQLDARLGAGALSGDGFHRPAEGDLAGMTVVDVDVEPALRAGDFALSLPSSLRMRETWGAQLSRTDARSLLSLDYRPLRALKLTVEGGAAASVRPGWLDPYQPVDDLPDNGLVPTDRRSRTQVLASARVFAVPWSKTFARLRYDFARTSTTRDPAFDALERPNHLAPRDNDDHALEASWKTAFDVAKPAIGVGVERTEWFFVFARDRGTGATHAGPGGAPPNPLQVLHAAWIEPELELALPGDVATVDAAWRVRAVDDVFQGYYSRVENRFRLGVDAVFGPAELQLATKARFSFTSVDYGDDGYAAGKTHPPLDFGDHRLVRADDVSLSARFPAKAPLHAFVDVDASSQLTNFPDYTPGIFPVHAAYSLDWDYGNVAVLAGVEFGFDIDDDARK